MTSEHDGLAAVRKHFQLFEVAMHQPEGVRQLANAFSLLEDLRASDAWEIDAQVAANIVRTYAIKVQRKLEQILSPESRIHWDTVHHWAKVLRGFQETDFSLPEGFAELLVALHVKKIGQFSPSERQELFDALESAG